MSQPVTRLGWLRRRLACWLAGSDNYVADAEEYRVLVEHHVACLRSELPPTWMPLSCREGRHRTDTVDGVCVCGAAREERSQ